MKRRYLAAILTMLLAYPLINATGFALANSLERRQLPLGRYTCVRAGDSSPLPDLKLVSRDKYEKENQTGVYVYEAGEGKIEWLTGAIPRKLVGFYIPKGVDNAARDTIVIREKQDAEEGNGKDLWRCSLAE